MASMKSFDEDMPSVGIFWYDPEEHEFFGVYKKELTPKMIEEAADKGLPFINYPRLHRQVWKEQYFRALASHKPTRFTGDYTMIPRGRVAWNIDKFIVFVGKWAEDVQDELTELINQHFALPFFEFVYDEHWALSSRAMSRLHRLLRMTYRCRLQMICQFRQMMICRSRT